MHSSVSTSFRRSSFCAVGTCVEVGRSDDGDVLVRDGKTADGPVLKFTPDEWRAFVAGVRNDEFDC